MCQVRGGTFLKRWRAKKGITAMKCNLGKGCAIRHQIASFKTDAALNQSIAAALEGNAHRIASVLAIHPMPAEVCVKLAEILQKAMMNPPQSCEGCGASKLKLAA
jgi:hypothetical protein